MENAIQAVPKRFLAAVAPTLSSLKLARMSSKNTRPRRYISSIVPSRAISGPDSCMMGGHTSKIDKKNGWLRRMSRIVCVTI